MENLGGGGGPGLGGGSGRGAGLGADGDLRAVSISWSVSSECALCLLFSEDHRCEDLSGIDWNGTARCFSNLSYANLTGQNMSGFALTGSRFHGAVMAQVSLQSASLCGADFSAVDFTDAQLSGLGIPPCIGMGNPPTYDCDTFWSGTIFDTSQGGAEPQSVGFLLLNPPCASVAEYGARNPVGSLSPISIRPLIGSAFTVGVDDPVGASASGALAVLVFATQPDQAFPAGTPLFGYGMSGPFGELLVSITPPNPFANLVGTRLWTTPGQPVPIDISIPDDDTLLGEHIYVQGVLTTPFNTKLTQGLDLLLGN